MTVACFFLAAKNTAQERRLDVDRMPLDKNRIKTYNINPEVQNLNTDSRRRKLDCMAAVHRLEAKENTKTVDVKVISDFAHYLLMTCFCVNLTMNKSDMTWLLYCEFCHILYTRKRGSVLMVTLV